ncbi:MAG: divalent-cation tolerance protein CutA [Candidatus Sulfotelmatobacter sp.]|jgi:uncharacterized protein involved in tolerance to divalent cations
MTDKRIALTTAASEDEARKIAHQLVERRLAACVNIIPQVSSIYRWQEKVEEAREWLLIRQPPPSLRFARRSQNSTPTISRSAFA